MERDERKEMHDLRYTMSGIAQTCNRIAGLVEDDHASVSQDLADMHEVLGNLIAAVNNLANIVHNLEVNPLKMVELISSNPEYTEKVKEITKSVTDSMASENLATLQAPADPDKYVFQNCTFNGPVVFEPNDFPPDDCDDEDFWDSYEDPEDEDDDEEYEDDEEDVEPDDEDGSSKPSVERAERPKCDIHHNYLTTRYHEMLISLDTWEKHRSMRGFPVAELKVILDFIVVNPEYYDSELGAYMKEELQENHLQYFLLGDIQTQYLLKKAEDRPAQYLKDLYEHVRDKVNYYFSDPVDFHGTFDPRIELTCHILSALIRKAKCYLQDEMMRGLEKDGGKE